VLWKNSKLVVMVAARSRMFLRAGRIPEGKGTSYGKEEKSRKKRR